LRDVEIGIPKDWVNGSWPTCPKCGAEFVMVRGLSSIGDVQMCSNPACENGIYEDAKQQIPGTRIAKKYERLDLDAVQNKIAEMVLQWRD